MNIFLIVAASIMAATSPTVTQPQQEGLRLFYEGPSTSDIDYLQQQFDSVVFVRDRQDAEVGVLVLYDYSPSGSHQVTTQFYGGVVDTLVGMLPPDYTQASERALLLRHLQAGLTMAMVKRGLDNSLQITTRAPQNRPVPVAPVKDPWNAWVFSTTASMNANGQETTNFTSLRVSASANQTRADRVLDFRGSYNRSESNFELSSGTITSITKSGSAAGAVIYSLGAHWGAGVFARMAQSSRNNTKVEYEVAPAIEYNIFPYAEATTRELRISYRVLLDHARYEQITLLERTEESILSHSLAATLDLKKKWGSASVSVSGTHHLTNFDRNLTDAYSLGGFLSTNLRLFKGVSIRNTVSASRIRDQFYLPLSTASEEEILLGAVGLPTGWNYYVSTSLTYRFGSIYNSVVNSRFGY